MNHAWHPAADHGPEPDAAGRTQQTLDGSGEQVPAEGRAGLEPVAMDLWARHFASTMVHVPATAEKIAHDPYHLSRRLSDAVDTVRKRG